LCNFRISVLHAPKDLFFSFLTSINKSKISSAFSIGCYNSWLFKSTSQLEFFAISSPIYFRLFSFSSFGCFNRSETLALIYSY
jgi:hypothetical protein